MRRACERQRACRCAGWPEWPIPPGSTKCRFGLCYCRHLKTSFKLVLRVAKKKDHSVWSGLFLFVFGHKLLKDGEGLRGIYPKDTFYRYRADLLKHGIAIRHPAILENVTLLVRVIRPEGIAQVPDWANNTSLYFESSNSKA